MSEKHDWKDDPRLVAYALEEWSELSESDVAEIDRALGKGGAEVDPECREALDVILGLIPDIERALLSDGESAAGAAGSGVAGAVESPRGASDPRDGDRQAGAVDMRLAGEARARIALAARRGAPSNGWGMPAMAAAALALVAGGMAWKLGGGPKTSHLDGTVQGEVARLDRGEPATESAAADKRGNERGSSTSQFKSGSKEDDDAAAMNARSRGGRHAEDLRGAVTAAGENAPMDGAFAGRLVTDSLDQQDQGLTEGGKSISPQPKLAQGADAPNRATDPQSRKIVPRGRSRDRSAAAPSQEPRIEDLAQPERERVFRVEKKRAEAPSKAPSERRQVGLTLEAPPEETIEELARVSLDEEDAPGNELPLPENPFIDAASDPFSTFSIDVDTASYTAARASISSGSLPPKRSVRPEEFINYFTYSDEGPKAGDSRPFAVHVDTGAAPWAPDHRLVRIGLKARSMDFVQRKRCSLVFLVDVSGSMRHANKLPLVKKALAILTESLHPEDRVALAVYASQQGLALDSTPVAAREAILQSLERLEGGGSTDGGTGIRLAYAVAREHFIEGGVNRVVLCTDGDFNVGITGEGELEELIAEEAKSGVELTVLGFGGRSVSGDGRMEALSNRGNGNYAMIDSELEARKVLATEVGGTLLTVAKDVKIQVAWNPEVVGAFRLIGYENRMLTHAQFLDDKKDAGEIGAGHGVTALYEVVPAGRPDLVAQTDAEVGEGRAQDTDRVIEPDLGGGAAAAEEAPAAFVGDGLVEVRVRFKQPGGDKSVGFAVTASDGGAGFNGAPEDLRFSATVAAFAMMLRGSQTVSGLTLEDIRGWSLESKGMDPGGLREGFIKMVEQLIEREKRDQRPKVR